MKIYEQPVWLRKIYYPIEYYIREKIEQYCKYLPKIKTKFPDAPHGGYCPLCHDPLIIHAYNTGDGWDFWWDCENEHWLEEEITHIIGWFPFVFGWANSKDLLKIGIEEH